MAASSSYSSSRNWAYDVFPSFSGEDVRIKFLSHFLKELDRKLIIAFKDNEIKRSDSLWPALEQAIQDSRIAVVVFSENYASSSWCLNELLEIVKCKEESGQMVIPVFYDLDPSHVRKQTGEFGKIFDKTCQKQTEEVKEEVKTKWKKALTNVANTLGFHSMTWGNEAKMVEVIANDVLDKLLITPSKDAENFSGIEDHMSNMSVLLELESEEVMMVGIWGSSGIGKTSIARVLFDRLARHFQGKIFIDRAFISKSMEIYSKANPYDYNMKLDLQRNFLSGILEKGDIRIDHLGAVEGRLKQQKVLIFIDDLDDQVVLDALVGETRWFGCGSRIVVVTKDMHCLRAHGIHHIYKVPLPSEELALEMFCRFAFRQKSPPDGFMELASEVALLAGNLPLGLTVLGSYLGGRSKEDWADMLPSLRNRLNGEIEKTLRVSYDGLNNENDKTIFRHIACLFNGETEDDIKQLLADSNLYVTSGLINLIDKSLVHVRDNTVEMHSLLQEMGKEIVRQQTAEPGQREFLMDAEDICDVFENKTGTKKVLGIALDIAETNGLHMHESAFKGMRNLLFLKFYTKKWHQQKDIRWHLPKRFDYFPPKLRLLRLDSYPMRCLPWNFSPEKLVKLEMRDSQLKKLWAGVHSLTGLKNMDLSGSHKLKEVPDLSRATSLEKLNLSSCKSLVELPSSIRYLNKLTELDMSDCVNLKTLPAGINLKSLHSLSLSRCFRLRSFPDISTNISVLDISQTAIDEFPSNLRLENLSELYMYLMKSKKLWERDQPLTPLMAMLSPCLTRLNLSHIPTLMELPSSIQKFHQLETLGITNCPNLEILPTDINLKSLSRLYLNGCSRLKTFPNISRNIFDLKLNNTGIQEVPWWIQNFSYLFGLEMNGCSNLQRVSLNFLKLKNLVNVEFSDCVTLTEASFDDSPSEMTLGTNKASASHIDLHFVNCINLDPKALIQQTIGFQQLILSGEEMPSCFTHRTAGTSLTNIPLSQTSLSQRFFRFRGCTLVDVISVPTDILHFDVQVCCLFIDRHGNHLDSADMKPYFATRELGGHLAIFDCHFPLAEQLNYDHHVDIQFHLAHRDSAECKLKGCGILLLEDSPSLDDPGYVNPNSDINVETREYSDVNSDRGNETHHSVESGGSSVQKRTNRNRKRVKMMGKFKKLLTCSKHKKPRTMSP